MPAGPARVDDFVRSVERVHVDAELARERTAAAVGVLRSIVSHEFDDPVLVHAELERAIERCEGQARRLRSSVESMRGYAGPVFEQWSGDLAAFSSDEMRARSAERHAVARESYDEIALLCGSLLESYDFVNAGLRDHALFLRNDLNAAAIALVENDARALIERANELDASLATCCESARGYVEMAALPLRIEADRAAAARPGS